MENIVGIKFTDKIKGEGAVITWGRIFDIIDATELLDVVKKRLIKCGANNIESIELCYSLMEISDQPYFYECLVYFIQNPIPFGDGYATWVKKKRKTLLAGKEISFLGFKKQYVDYLERKTNGFLPKA